MKMLFIAYNEAIDEEVMEIIEEHSVTGYTKWTKVLGRGEDSGPHLLSHVWPAGNNCLAVVMEDEKALAIMDDFRKLRVEVSNEGLKAFMLPVLDYTE